MLDMAQSSSEMLGAHQVAILVMFHNFLAGELLHIPLEGIYGGRNVYTPDLF